NFVYAKLQLFHQMKNRHHAKNSNTVGDECRRVFTKHRRLSKVQITVMHQEVCNLRVRGSCWNYLEKAKISWWIEKVSTTKMFLEIITSALAHEMDRNAGCI